MNLHSFLHAIHIQLLPILDQLTDILRNKLITLAHVVKDASFSNYYILFLEIRVSRATLKVLWVQVVWQRRKDFVDYKFSKLGYTDEGWTHSSMQKIKDRIKLNIILKVYMYLSRESWLWLRKFGMMLEDWRAWTRL